MARKESTEKNKSKPVERRKRGRRVHNDRRDMVRWEPEKPGRRKGKDRRKSAAISWDDVIKKPLD